MGCWVKGSRNDNLQLVWYVLCLCTRYKTRLTNTKKEHNIVDRDTTKDLPKKKRGIVNCIVKYLEQLREQCPNNIISSNGENVALEEVSLSLTLIRVNSGINQACPGDIRTKTSRM